jgi:hypothetical protein
MPTLFCRYPYCIPIEIRLPCRKWIGTVARVLARLERNDSLSDAVGWSKPPGFITVSTGESVRGTFSPELY